MSRTREGPPGWDGERLFGHPLLEWVVSGALSAEGVAFVLRELEAGRAVCIQPAGWIKLAGLSAAYARVLWTAFGGEWQGELARYRRVRPLHAASPDGRAAQDILIAQTSEEVRALRGLSGQ